MSTEYMEHIKQFFSDIHEDIIKDLRNKDKEYSRLIKNIVKESIKIEEIYSSLNDKERSFISKNEDCTKRIDWIEREALYFQGYRDCIKLLKNLELIWQIHKNTVKKLTDKAYYRFIGF